MRIRLQHQVLYNNGQFCRCQLVTWMLLAFICRCICHRTQHMTCYLNQTRFEHFLSFSSFNLVLSLSTQAVFNTILRHFGTQVIALDVNLDVEEAFSVMYRKVKYVWAFCMYLDINIMHNQKLHLHISNPYVLISMHQYHLLTYKMCVNVVHAHMPFHVQDMVNIIILLGQLDFPKCILRIHPFVLFFFYLGPCCSASLGCTKQKNFRDANCFRLHLCFAEGISTRKLLHFLPRKKEFLFMLQWLIT